MSRLFKSMTGVVILAILVFSMLANTAPVFAADATMSVSPATITVTSGQNFNVTVSLNTAVNVNALGFQMDWNGPEGAVHCNGISLTTGAGSFFHGFSPVGISGQMNADNGTKSQYCWSVLGSQVVTAPRSGPVAVLSFTATRAGQVNFLLREVQVTLAGETVSTDISDGGGMRMGGQSMHSSGTTAPVIKAASNDIETAKKYADAYIKEASARTFPQWQGCQPTFIRVFENAQGAEIGCVFSVTNNGVPAKTTFQQIASWAIV